MDFIQNLSISHMYIGNIIIANHISINISYNILSALHGSIVWYFIISLSRISFEIFYLAEC